MQLCQATRTSPATVTIPSKSPDGPYLLSAEAAERLKNLALRPLEWFNLAVVHGPLEFYLHDDFYDDDGTAGQPQVPVSDADKFPAPNLSECASDLDHLINFALTRWFLKSDVVEALKRHDPQSLLQKIHERFGQIKDPWLKSRLLGVAGKALGNVAASWVRALAAQGTADSNIALMWAAAACLPPDEARAIAEDALASIPPERLAHECLVLAQFRSPEVLEWIERNVHEPFTSRWGDLAAASPMTWDLVKKWLARGRPLSLIALDALAACNGPRPNQSPLIRELKPRLRNPASIEEMDAYLQAHALIDPSPRVKKSVNFIQGGWPRICGTEDAL
jgi:hypothetical protein